MPQVLIGQAGAITLAAFVLLRETYPPTLLERKTKRLRKETGNQNLKSKLASELSPKALFKIAIVRPAKMLIFSPIVLVLSSFMAIVYGYLYLLFTTITEVFEQRYHFSQGAVGLTYLGIGLGMFCGLLGFGSVSDRLVKCMSRNGVMKPEYRLPPMIPGAACVPIGLFIYGWTADKHVFWIVPIIGTAFGILRSSLPTLAFANKSRSRRRHPCHLHAHFHLPRRRLHHPRRLGTRRQRLPTVHPRRAAPPRRPEDVRHPGFGMGELAAGIRRAGNVSDHVVVLSVWRADTDKSEVSGEVLDECC